jgi:hypothetical protein
MALPPGAIGSAVREEKLAWRANRVKAGLPICSSSNLARCDTAVSIVAQLPVIRLLRTLAQGSRNSVGR